MPQDETMSQEQAFATGKPDEAFSFPEAEVVPPAPPAEPPVEETPAPSVAPATVVPPAEEEQRVPYSRFKKKVEEADELKNRLDAIEERLKNPPKTETKSDMPEEWVELYGDSDIAKKAWAVQQKREDAIRKEAIKESIESIKREQQEQAQREKENEETVDEYLSSLSTAYGKKLTKAQEEALLTIVDEFSPTNPDGTYASLLPVERALEIFELRNAKKGAPVIKARAAVADLTNGGSDNTTPDESAPFKRGWDNWREALN